MTDTQHLLLVTADDTLRRALSDHLEGQGFLPRHTADAAAAPVLVAEQPVDGVLVDAGLPGAAIQALCRDLRRRKCEALIVVLGASPADMSGLRAAGASEFIAKPFRVALLTERLRVWLREAAAQAPLHIGELTLSAMARLLIDGAGRRIRLTEKEAAILAYLHRAAPRVVPREELLGEVWGYAQAVSTHTVETHIYRLRRKLEGSGLALLTEAGGYGLGTDPPPPAEAPASVEGGANSL
jgi:DNA-binding response OmpR family regulator